MKKIVLDVVIGVPDAYNERDALKVVRDVEETIEILRRLPQNTPWGSVRVEPARFNPRTIHSDDACDYCTHDFSQGNCNKSCELYGDFQGRKVLDA